MRAGRIWTWSGHAGGSWNWSHSICINPQVRLLQAYLRENDFSKESLFLLDMPWATVLRVVCRHAVFSWRTTDCQGDEWLSGHPHLPVQRLEGQRCLCSVPPWRRGERCHYWTTGQDTLWSTRLVKYIWWNLSFPPKVSRDIATVPPNMSHIL